MTLLDRIKFENISIEKIKTWADRICLIVSENEENESYIMKIDKLMQGRLRRTLLSEEFQQLSTGESLLTTFPVGLTSTELEIFKIKNAVDSQEYRLVGGSIARKTNKEYVLIIAEFQENIVEILYGIFLKSYSFTAYKSKCEKTLKEVVVAHSKFERLKKEFQFFKSLLHGIYFCRDLINEPANVLNTIEFARRLKSLESYGLKVDILEEDKLKKLGMRAILAVGQGSECPSKVVIVRWEGKKNKSNPLLLLGKGVVFDSGGISIKPSGGMEEMVMDMGGAGVVAGTMKAIALRKSPANVIGLIGLVENMPDGKAQRPGDVVKTMKGDTVEVINTDAEGRLVLCDLLWYAQTKFHPKAVIDLATLTGAVIVALGHHNAGVFSNNNDLCENFLRSAQLEGEGAWRLPLGPDYQKLLKSRIADIANVGGRAAGAITAAQFLKTFVKDEVPWMHIDIAGVAFSKNPSKLSSSGATGWGVASLNRLVCDYFENEV